MAVTVAPGSNTHASATGAKQRLENPYFAGPKTAPRNTGKIPPGIVPDAVWPGMYRLVLADGSLSDKVNLTRAKDALNSTRYLQ
jgi:hypothetical protein